MERIQLRTRPHWLHRGVDDVPPWDGRVAWNTFVSGHVPQRGAWAHGDGASSRTYLGHTLVARERPLPGMDAWRSTSLTGRVPSLSLLPWVVCYADDILYWDGQTGWLVSLDAGRGGFWCNRRLWGYVFTCFGSQTFCACVFRRFCASDALARRLCSESLPVYLADALGLRFPTSRRL